LAGWARPGSRLVRSYSLIEANFRPRSEYERTKLTGLAGRIAEVHCACSPDLALRRYNERTSTRHLIHAPTTLTPEAMAEWDQPVGIGALITVDTTAPVGVTKVAAEVRRYLEDA
jgi:hypothetical protein